MDADVRTSRRRSWGVITAVAVVAGMVTSGGTYGASATDEAPEPLGPGEVTIEVGMKYTQFDVDEIRVRPGTRVRFVLKNEDPIGHEMIVGDELVHAQHAAGTHAEHPPVPGEVSVEPLETAVTTYEFDDPGTIEFACHLPGHYDYGMRGEIVVVTD